MGEEGAAGDGGGEEQGGGQAALDGKILLNDEVKFPQYNTMLLFLVVSRQVKKFFSGD